VILVPLGTGKIKGKMLVERSFHGPNVLDDRHALQYM
jgi:hypothetical protein